MKGKSFQKILAGSCVVLTAMPMLAQQKPNIVLFYVDDMGYGDLSITGCNGYTTPNIDRLANEGMFFTHYYASSPISTASRAGLLTGCYATRVSVPGAYLTNPNVGLNPREEILPELLKSAGYHSGLVGKWHLGCGEYFMPNNQGFDEFYGLPYSNDIWPVDFEGNPITEETTSLDPASKVFRMSFPTLRLYDNQKVIKEIWTMQEQDELTTLYTERSIKFIEDNKDKPFFLLVTHDMPHVPLAVSDKFKGKSTQGLYGDAMMEVDWSVGEIMKELKANGLDDNTIVMFTSDNGPWLTYGDHSGSAAALREGKQCSFEGGHRVPFLIRWKGHVPQGVVNPQLISNLDILPTLVAITGASLPKEKIDGVNVLSLWEGETQKSPREYFYYYYSLNPSGVLKSLEGVRDNRFKLVFPHIYNSNEGEGVKIGKGGYPGQSKYVEAEMALYDLRMDQGERNNVIDQYPEVVEKLKTAADRMRQDLGDDLQGVESNNLRPGGEIK